MLSRSKSAGRSSDGTSIESGVRCIRHLSCVLCVEQLHHTRKVTVCHWWGTNPHQPDFATALTKNHPEGTRPRTKCRKPVLGRVSSGWFLVLDSVYSPPERVPVQHAADL